MFLDSHCHLTSPELSADIAGVLERAVATQVTGFLNIGDNIESSHAACAQAAQAQQQGIKVWATAGVHPQHALEYNDQAKGTTEAILALAKHPLVRAIGEIGLDFVYDDQHPQYPGASREVQADVLRQQLTIAITLGLPVVIHNREADEALLAIMQDYSNKLPGGVFHCFGSSLEVARRVLDLGFHLGFTGLVTFKNAAGVREVAKFCPIDRLLIETDAPYLAPVPYRGKTNEPSYLPRVAETIASIHNLDVAEVSDRTTHNAMQLFRLDEQKVQAEKNLF